MLKMEEQSIFENEKNNIGSKKLSVHEMNYGKTIQCYWDELFNGFDSLYAVTYSSSLDFLKALSDRVHNMNVIFGYRDVISHKTRSLMELQLNILSRITKDKNVLLLSERMNNRSLNLYASLNRKSHEKLYILSEKNGRKRVIFGSANMSSVAWKGIQQEGIYMCDDGLFFENQLTWWHMMKDNYSSYIDPVKVKKIIDNPEDLSASFDAIPVVSDVNSKKTIVVGESKEQFDYEDDGYDFVIDKSLFDNNQKEIDKILKNEKNGHQKPFFLLFIIFKILKF